MRWRTRDCQVLKVALRASKQAQEFGCSGGLRGRRQVQQVQALELCRQIGSVSPGSPGSTEGSSSGYFPDVLKCHRCMSVCLWYIHTGLTHNLAQMRVCSWVKPWDVLQQTAQPFAVSGWFFKVFFAMGFFQSFYRASLFFFLNQWIMELVSVIFQHCNFLSAIP